MHKAPLTEAKQIEHIVNERKILEAADYSFCVRLVHSFQDAKSLYLLQEWVSGNSLSSMRLSPYILLHDAWCALDFQIYFEVMKFDLREKKLPQCFNMLPINQEEFNTRC